MNTSNGIGWGAALIVSILALCAWHRAHQAQQEARALLISGDLQPIASMLNENQRLIRELQTDPSTEHESGILECYLARIRRDGVTRHADMKQRLDELAENNTTIVALIKTYSVHATTPAFTQEADKFRNYASVWRDRWNSVMELYMVGGNYTTAAVPLPNGFADAVQAEIAAVR